MNLACGWSTSISASLAAQVIGNASTIPAAPQSAPQNVRATTTVRGCKSRPACMSCGSTVQPKVLWMRNGTSTTRSTSWRVLPGVKDTNGTGAMIEMQEPKLGMNFKRNVMMPKMSTSSTPRAQSDSMTAKATMRLVIVLNSRYLCIILLTRDLGNCSLMPGKIATRQKRNSSRVTTALPTISMRPVATLVSSLV